MKSNVTKTIFYEEFIKRARNCKTGECGADNRYMLSLLELRQKSASADDPFYRPRIDQVKQFLSMACVVSVMKNLSPEDEAAFYDYLNIIDETFDCDVLLNICEKGLHILNRYD